MRVGFIGLGAMGRPMAVNVLAGGFELTVFDLSGSAVEELVELGAVGAPSPELVAEASDIVITMLPRPSDVEEVVLGPSGIAHVMKPGAALIDMSTGDPVTTRRIAAALAERGIDAVDCPVGRTQAHARAGTLLLMAGGSDAAIDRVRPVLVCMGKDLRICGDVGSGQAMKLVNNMLSIIVTQAIAEVLSVGLKAGLTLDVIRTTTGLTMAQTAMMDAGLPAKAFNGDIEPGFALRLAEKDIALAAGLAKAYDIATPTADATLARCIELMEKGHSDDDIGIMVLAALEQAGVDIIRNPASR